MNASCAYILDTVRRTRAFLLFFRTVLVSTPCRQVGSREGVYMDERVAEDKKPKEPKNRPSTRGGGRREETTIAQQRRRRRRTDDGRWLQKQQQQHDNLQQQLMQSAASLAPATTLWKRNVNSTINNSNESKQQKWTKIFTQKPPQNPQLNKGNKTFFFYCYASTKITIGQRRNFFFYKFYTCTKGEGEGPEWAHDQFLFFWPATFVMNNELMTRKMMKEPQASLKTLTPDNQPADRKDR